MTISATTRRFDYAGNGVTVDFSFPRPFAANTDLKVYLVLISTGVATLQTYSTDYSVAGAGLDVGGTVTFLVAPSALYKVVIFADTDATQNLDLDAVTSWPMTAIEYAFDRLTIMVQEMWDRLLRVPYAPREYINAFDYKLPQPEAAKVLGVKSDGSGFEYLANTGGGLSIEQVQDLVAAMLVAGSNVSISYDDTLGEITIASSGGGGGGASVTISDTAPGSPSAGDLWWNSTNGRLYVYYTDANSSQWVDAMAAGSLTAADILAMLLTVDGSGSGLDADLLDGQSAAYYATAAQFSALTAGVSSAFDTLLEIENAINGKAAIVHTHTASEVTDFSEAVDDRVAALLVAGTNITLSYNDGTGTLTINATGGGGGADLGKILARDLIMP